MKNFWLATLVWVLTAFALGWSILMAVKGNVFPLVLVSGGFFAAMGKIGCAAH